MINQLQNLMLLIKSMVMADLVTVSHARVPTTRPTTRLGRPHTQNMMSSIRSVDLVP